MKKFAIVHYRTAPEAPLQHHVEKAIVQSHAMVLAMEAIPCDQIVGITLGDEKTVSVLQASRVIDLGNQLLSALEEASAALPDAWKAVDCNVPVELIRKLTRLVEACRAEGLDPSNRLKPMQVQWTVVGGEGDFNVCAVTGRVLTAKEDMPDAYRSYELVNVDEYRTWCRQNGLSEPATVDICAVRLFDGEAQSWEPAEEDARADILASLKAAA